MAAIEEYNKFKRENKSTHAQKSTDFAIINFLEYALCSKILVDDVPNITPQVTDVLTQDPSPTGAAQSGFYDQPSPELEIYGDDSDTMTIFGRCSDLSEHSATITSTTPDILPEHFRDSLSLSYNVSMAYNYTLNGKEMFELDDQVPDEVIESVEWEY